MITESQKSNTNILIYIKEPYIMTYSNPDIPRATRHYRRGPLIRMWQHDKSYYTPKVGEIWYYTTITTPWRHMLSDFSRVMTWRQDMSSNRRYDHHIYRYTCYNCKSMCYNCKSIWGILYEYVYVIYTYKIRSERGRRIEGICSGEKKCKGGYCH